MRIKELKLYKLDGLTESNCIPEGLTHCWGHFKTKLEALREKKSLEFHGRTVVVHKIKDLELYPWIVSYK